MVKKTEIERSVTVSTTKAKPDHPHGGPPGQTTPPPTTEPPPTTTPPPEPTPVPPIVIVQPPIISPPEPVVGAFNGGRSTLNLSTVQLGAAYPFLNMAKTMGAPRGWGRVAGWVTPGDGGTAFQASTKAPDGTTLYIDAKGYPTAAYLAVWTSATASTYLPSIAQRSGQYRVTWTGTGAIRISVGGTLLTTSGTYVNNPDAADHHAQVIITANPNDDMDNLAIVHEDDVDAFDAGGTFGVKFMEVLRALNPGCIRFLDWFGGNNIGQRYWADRKPTDYISYSMFQHRPDLWVDTTTNSGDDYSCSAPSGWTGLVDKACVIVRINADATTLTPTLNVASTGAKTIKQGGAALFSSQKPDRAEVGVFVYDADLDCWLKRGGDGADHSCFMENLIPPEICLQLCEELGAHPWFVPPCMACDPTTDYMQGLATYCRDNAPAWMIPRFELAPNETWNTGFPQTGYASNKALQHWASASASDWVGMVASNHGQIINAVYGGAVDGALYHAIIGAGAFQSDSSSGGPVPPYTTQGQRLESTLWVAASSPAAASGCIVDEAKNWGTHLTIATYIEDTLTSAEEATAVSDWTAAAGNAPLQLSIITDFVESTRVTGFTTDLKHGIGNYIDNMFPHWVDFLEAHLATGSRQLTLCCYEGGWQYGGDVAFNSACKAYAGLQDIIHDLFQGLIDAGGEFPASYVFTGTGTWGIYDPDIYATSPPTALAIAAWNA